jgi:hypothetical protein
MLDEDYYSHVVVCLLMLLITGMCMVGGGGGGDLLSVSPSRKNSRTHPITQSCTARTQFTLCRVSQKGGAQPGSCVDVGFADGRLWVEMRMGKCGLSGG